MKRKNKAKTASTVWELILKIISKNY